MKKITFALMILLGNISLISCTADSLAETEAELKIFATEGEDDDKPEPDGSEGGEN